MTVDQENPQPQPTPENELPDWLKEIRGEAPAAKSKPVPQSDLPEEAVADIDELPPWLQDVPAEPFEPEEAESAAEEPFAAEEPMETVAAEAEAALEVEETIAEKTEMQAKDVSEVDMGKALWEKILAEEGVSLDEVPEERPEGAEDMSVRDWMQATADESAKRLAAADAKTQSAKTVKPEVQARPPADVSNESAAVEEPAAAEAVDDGMVIEDELPDWLKDGSVPEVETETPSWLSDESIIAAASEIPAEAAEETIPEWLQEDTAADTGEIDTGVPAWLSDESTIDTGETLAEEAVTAEVTADEETLPDWLREDAVADTGEVDTTVPAWLSDESTVEVEEPAAELQTEAESAAAEELPDWLKEDEISEAEADVPEWISGEDVVEEVADFEADVDIEAVEMAEELSEDELVIAEELPDWLKEDVVAEIDEAEVPSWLSDERIIEEPVAEEEVVAEEVIFDDEELPDWLQEGEELWSESAVEEVSAEAAELVAETSESEEAAEPEAPAEVIERTAAVEVPESAAAEETPVPEPVATAEDEQLTAAVNALKAGQVGEALRIFGAMIEKSTRLEEIVENLSAHLDAYADNPAVFETLGDAQTRLGQLNKAFQSYKTALRKL